MENRTRSPRVWTRVCVCVWCGDACAVLPKAWSLHSHVIGIVGTCADRQYTPQVPRIHVSLFPHRPTAHAPTLKLAPDPSHHQKSLKNTLYLGQNHYNGFNKNLKSDLSYIRDVCEVRVTSRPLVFTIFSKQNTDTEFASWRLASWTKEEAMECSD